MYDPKTGFNDRLTAAADAKKALLARFKPKPTVQAEVIVDREAEKAAKREQIRQERLAAKQAKADAAVAAEEARRLAIENDADLQLQMKRAERKERKAAEKAAARAKKEARAADRRAA